MSSKFIDVYDFWKMAENAVVGNVELVTLASGEEQAYKVLEDKFIDVSHRKIVWTEFDGIMYAYCYQPWEVGYFFEPSKVYEVVARSRLVIEYEPKTG